MTKESKGRISELEKMVAELKELDGGQELDGRQDGRMVGRSWIAGRSSMAGRMAGWWAGAG